MINNKNDMLQGPISIFDLEFIQPQETKKEIKHLAIVKPKENHDKFTELINLYSSNATRIVKRVSGALLVEIEDKTLYFNLAGINEFELKKDIELMPADEIFVVNEDREVNELQLKKLEDMHVDQYIKRKGDANIIILFENKTVVINPKGWILEYLQKAKYHENELFITKSVNEVTEFQNDEDEKEDLLQIGNRVEFNYDGPKVGDITSIYNNGETVNVVWDHKHTAFYYKCVKKIS